jgi:DNA primase
VTYLAGQGFTNTEIIDAGLGRVEQGGRLRDVFSDRLMFPVHDPDSGMVIAFTGRKNPSGVSDNVPKYFNSATTDLFNKSEIPFGLDYATQEMLRGGAQLVIVEGPMDALAVRKARPDLAVIAPLGTALTEGQLATVDKIAPLRDRRVVVLMDADAAGLKAAMSAHDKLRAFGVQTPETVALPRGTDPAQLLQDRGETALAVELTHRRPLSDVKVDGELTYWIHDVPAEDCGVEHRFNAVRASAPMVAGLPPGEQAHQIARMAEVTGWPASEVFDIVQNYRDVTSAELIDANARLSPQTDPPYRSMATGTETPAAGAANGLSSPMAATLSPDPVTAARAHGR